MKHEYPFHTDSVFLVTGGAGFIGSNICEKLIALGLTVRCFDNLSNGNRKNIAALENNTRFTFIEGDIRNAEQCLAACTGVDYVLHNAALGSVVESMKNPALYQEVNIDGMENMLTASVTCGVKKFVYASSAAVYGDAGKRIAIEGEEGKALSVYAETKQENEKQAKRYTEQFGLDTYGLRYFNVFGKGQRHDSPYSAVIPNFLNKLLKGIPAHINGDGLQTRDFVYVADIVQANLKACLAESDHAGEAFNIACGTETTVLDLYYNIANALNLSAEPVFGPAITGDIRYSRADITKAETILKYHPNYTFAEGITLSTEWYKANIR